MYKGERERERSSGCSTSYAGQIDILAFVFCAIFLNNFTNHTDYWLIKLVALNLTEHLCLIYHLILCKYVVFCRPGLYTNRRHVLQYHLTVQQWWVIGLYTNPRSAKKPLIDEDSCIYMWLSFLMTYIEERFNHKNFYLIKMRIKLKYWQNIYISI